MGKKSPITLTYVNDTRSKYYSTFAFQYYIKCISFRLQNCIRDNIKFYASTNVFITLTDTKQNIYLQQLKDAVK